MFQGNINNYANTIDGVMWCAKLSYNFKLRVSPMLQDRKDNIISTNDKIECLKK